MDTTGQAIAGSDILVVEDSLTQALQLQYILSQQGHAVTLAKNGREALTILEFLRPTLIISDIVMPELNGYEMCEVIKGNPVLATIPVILLTNLADAEDIVRGLRAKADCYLTKPYSINYLLRTIETLLANPPRNGEEQGEELEVTVAGKSYEIKTNRRQMLNLLLSIYGSAVQRNQELEQTQRELRSTMERLGQQQLELEKANARLQALVTQDGLTGINNRHAFNERLEEEFSRGERYRQPLSLLLLDLDHFKAINDTYGHLAGDTVLQQAAQIIRECSRDTDFVARYGGEEFAVLLPSTEAAGARIWAERIRQGIEVYVWEHRPLTVSIGIATCFDASASCTNSRYFVDQADQALYRAKESGRNQVLHFDDSQL